MKYRKPIMTAAIMLPLALLSVAISQVPLSVALDHWILIVDTAVLFAIAFSIIYVIWTEL